MRWINTKTEAKFKHAILPDGSVNLVIVGLSPDSPEWAKAISEMKMRPSMSGKTLIRAGGKFTLEEVRRVFPGAEPIADLPESDIYLSVVSGKAPSRKMSDDERRANVDLQTYIPLGLNYLGQEVFVMADGTRYVSAATGTSISESSAAIPAAFLRAASESDLALCAEGFVLQMDRQMMRSGDLRRFAGIVFGENAPLKTADNRLRGVQEAIESAILRRFAGEHQEASLAAFQRAVHLDNHQPVFGYRDSDSVALQQYSTPLPLSVAAQHIVGDANGLKVLEPAIGNGSLVSMLRGAEITGCEISAARSRQVEGVFGGDNVPKIVTGDFTALSQTLPGDFDVVIANPPFGGLDKPVQFMGLQVTRIDHLIALQALSRRKPDGISVFIVGADHDNIYPEKAGVISGGSLRFFNWLTDHYEVKAFEVAGNLYAKQGAGYPVRVVAVGAKLPDEIAATRKKGGAHRLAELSVARTTDELWEAAVSVRSWISGAPVTEEEEIRVAEAKGEFQAQYIPLSKTGESSSMVPINLAAPQANAFERLFKAVGNVDDFVKRELQLDSLEMFEPEQIDAIALAIFDAQRNRGLILADKTGLGKGRVVAALARYAVLNDRVALFLTDTANLFSDFWRDVKHIGSEDLFKPFILNTGESVIDITDTGEVEIPKTPAAMQKKVIDSLKSPKEFGFNLALMTYSQFNRVGSAKSQWLLEASKGAYLIMDESHKAAGESNTSITISQAVRHAWSVTYSSATYAKDAKNMLVYSKAFPPSVNLDTLSDTLKAGGEALQEVISAMLCDDGVLIRRESDLSHLTFEVVVPSADILQRNREIADKVSGVLAMMSYLSGDVEKIVGLEYNLIKDVLSAENAAAVPNDPRYDHIKAKLEGLPDEVRANNRMGVSYINFGSRLYAIQRQLMLILAADTTLAESLSILRSGGKPVIAVEQTMETFLKEFSGEAAGDRNDTRPITFRDLLFRMADGITMISRRDAYGTPEKVSVFDVMDEIGRPRKEIEDAFNELKALIAEVPDISAMPLDVIKQGFEDAGYTIGEVSGRTSEIRVADGKTQIMARDADRSVEIFDFNSGKYDGILLTGGAAATGVSLHASVDFADKRRRFLLEAQIANDVAKRVQLFGRVDRRGQVSHPGIKSITSGLPSEIRVLAMQNQKLRSMSANTQSNRSNASEMKDIPDILNEVGDHVCREYLFSNPQIAAALSIELVEEKDDPTYFVNKLTGRISLLPVAKQEEIYEALLEGYKIRIDELNSTGQNPFKSHTLDVNGEVIKSFVLHKKGGGDSLFDAPIVAEKIQWSKMVEPIRMAQVKELVVSGVAKLMKSAGITELPNTNLIGGVRALNMDGFMEVVHKAFLDLAMRSLPAKFANLTTEENPMAGIKAAIEDSKNNIIKKIDKRHDWLDGVGRQMTPGRAICWSSGDDLRTGVVVSLHLPPEGKEHHLGQWRIDLAIPGEEDLVSLTFNQLFEDEKHRIFTGLDAANLAGQFDAAKQGEVSFSRWLLTGNLFAASESAAKTNLGRAGIVTLKDGSHRRAIICRSSVDESMLRHMPIALSTPEECIQRISEGVAKKPRGLMSFGGNFSLSWRNEVMTITTPGSKKDGGRIFLDKEIAKALGSFAGNRESMIARFDARNAAKIELVVRKLYALGMTGDIPADTEDEPRLAA